MLRNRYRVLERLGAGGGGTVYAVEDARSGDARLALKALWPQADSTALLTALRSEFRVLAALRHPRLGRVFDFGRLPPGTELDGAPAHARDRGGYFLTRQLVDGTDLRAAAARRRDPNRVCRALAEAARLLDVLHRAGMRHGDFKPANVIVDGDDRVHLIDFGLATTEHARTAAGTLPYLAPEILAGDRVDRRADLYAIGVSLFELCTGGFPSGDARGHDLARWHLAGERPPLPSASDELGAVYARLIARDPQARYPTAGEAAAALAACAGAAETTDDGPVPVVIPAPAPEARELDRALERRIAGRGGPAMIEVVGDVGAGKSALLTEHAWRAELRGAEVVRADVAAPRAAIEAALDELAAITGEAVPTGGDRLARFAAIGGWLANASRAQPIALLFDDFDFADEESRALTEYLGRALPADARVSIAIARRPRADDADRDPTRVGELPQLRLRPLTAEQIGELIRDAAARRAPELAERVHRHTGGNRLHVAETLRHLAARGFPPADPLDDAPMPAALDDLAARELAELPEPERRSLATLAVLERPCPPSLWAALGDGPVAEALARGILQRDPDGALRFARPATRQALYRDLPAKRRRSLHGRCADALAGAGASEDERAIHDVRSGDRERALASALPAAERAFAAHDYPRARDLFESALALVGDRDERARTARLRLGELARVAGEPAAAAEHLAPLVDAGDNGARLTLARARDEAGDQDGAAALLRAIIDDAPASPEGLAAARELARSHLKRGRSADAIEIAEAAIPLAEADGGGGIADELRAARAFARGVLGDDTLAREELGEIAARAVASGDRAAEAAAANYDAVLAFRRGDYARARARYTAALRATDAIGDVIRSGTLRMNLASLAFHSGQYASAREHLVAAVSLLRAARAETSCTFARRNLGHLLLELGEYEQARAELRAAVDAAARLRLDSPRAACHALLGIIGARSGDLDGGRRELARARALFAELGDKRATADTLLDIAEVELEAADGGDATAAEAALADAAQLAGDDEDANRRARRLALACSLAAARDDDAAAAAQVPELREAIERVRAEGARHLEWSLRLGAAAGEELLRDRDAAAGHRAAAVGILEEIAAELPPAQRAAFWSDPRRKSLREPAGVIVPSTVDLRDTLPSDSSVSRTSERLFRLLEIYRRMSSERDLDRLLELAMDTAVELTGAERGFLLLAPEDSDELELAIARNLPSIELQAMRDRTSVPEPTYSRSIAERVFRTGEPVLSRSAREDPRFDRAASVHALALESVVCIPVRERGRITGVLYMESRFASAQFGADDLRLLQAFGDQVAIVLANARLLEENAARADELARAHAEIAALLDERTAELAVAHRDLERTRSLYKGAGAFGLVGRSQAMERVYHLIERLAETDVPVLVLGESGTGKELIARALHEHGPRRERPRVSINCGALPEQLLASELFGHVKGAFTGADKAHRGLFQTADGGTLFLDEIGDTPARMQATLLRALQEHTIRPVGGSKDIRVDVRVVAATNRPLEELVAEGRFREDLYYRLHVVAIQLPPLRERRDDIPLLCDHFLALIAERTGIDKKGITRRALRRLVDYDWPGNVRQLEHALTNAAVMADGSALDVDDFAATLAPAAGAQAAAPPSEPARRRRERDQIVEALEAHGWNKTKAARALGIPRRTFYRRLAEYDIG